jgi:hypothetical protein
MLLLDELGLAVLFVIVVRAGTNMLNQRFHVTRLRWRGCRR